MTPFDRLLEFLSQNWKIEVNWLAKGGVVFFLVLYLVFTLVVVKQIKLMKNTLNGFLEQELMFGARLLVGLAIAALVMALIIL